MFMHVGSLSFSAGTQTRRRHAESAGGDVRLFVHQPQPVGQGNDGAGTVREGRRRRARSLPDVTTPSACPHLEESRDCSIISCYSWQLEQQDECFLPKGRNCGKGTRKLLFRCVDYQGVSRYYTTRVYY